MTNKTKPVTIIDSIMGSGKTSWAIQYMNHRSDKRFIYVTPYLEEVERIIDSCPKCRFEQPLNIMGKRKVENFKDLISNGGNIATTHVTFSDSTEAIINLIREQGYTLILDEAIEGVSDFNDACDDRIGKADIKLLLDKNMISIEEDYRVLWKAESYADSKYGNFERCAKDNNLYCIDKKTLIWVFPYQLFTAFEEVYVMTYLYDGSYLRPYMEYYGLPVVMKSVEYDEAKQRYWLTDHIKGKDQETRNQMRQLIRLHQVPCEYSSLFTKTALSVTDLKNMPHALDVIEEKTFNGRIRKQQLEQDMNPYTKEGKRAIRTYNKLQDCANRANLLTKLLRKYLRDDMKAHTNEIMWTTVEKMWKTFRGDGYRIKELTLTEQKLPPKEQAKLKAKKISFVPCNARATNVFRNKTVLAYLYNVYVNPEYKKFFQRKGIRINERLYAVSFLLQWIFRSAIRDGKPIDLFLPSQRMTDLLNEWLDGEI